MMMNQDGPVYKKGEIVTDPREDGEFGLNVTGNNKFRIILITDSNISDLLFLTDSLYHEFPEFEVDPVVYLRRYYIDKSWTGNEISLDELFAMVNEKPEPDNPQNGETIV